MSQSLSPSRESKFSRKAEAVYAALAGTKAHPSAEQLYLSLKEVYPNISKTTVYSNLAKLRDDGAVVCVAVVDGRERFDANTMAHPHFICSCCGSVLDLEVKSVKKKFKDKGFAAGVSRDVILNGCDLLGLSLDEVIEETILGMRKAHEALGL